MQDHRFRLLNPLLDAVFNHPQLSTKHKELLDSLANHSASYTILVPETAKLEWSVDKETSIPFRDLCIQDDFISSHVIQVPANSSKNHQRARYFGTMNGKTIIINDGHVHAHRGFKSPIKTRILEEYVFNPGTYPIPSQALLMVYVIEDPLVGIPVPSKEVSPTISSKYQLASMVQSAVTKSRHHKKHEEESIESSVSVPPLSFERLMGNYPVLARHVYTPLRMVIDNFQYQNAECTDDLVNSLDSSIDVAIQIFQSGDSNSITEMTSDFDVTGEEVTELLHEYVERNVGEKLWQKLIELRSDRDQQTREAIERIKYIDIAQIGIPDADSGELARLDKLVNQAVDTLDRLDDSIGSENKIGIFLSVLQVLSRSSDNGGSSKHVNADYLVSLLVLVVCRSSVESIDSQLNYIKTFTYKNVESGQLGYALLTFEGVLYHIIKETSNLENLSDENEKLWKVINNKNDIDEYIDELESNIDEWRTIIKSRKDGESCLMQSIQCKYYDGVEKLLSTDELNLDYVLGDRTQNGSTLIIAAVQSEQESIINLLLDIISQANEDRQKEYFNLEDEFQRTVGHYFFHAPQLISRIGHLTNWINRDHNGQTPLFGLFRCYDHPNYEQLIDAAFKSWYSPDATLLDHIDNRGNTLLHIVKTKSAMEKVLAAHPDINYPNEKGLTPLMIYSKYSRRDAILIISKNPILDMDRSEDRGLTALELAKDVETISLLDEIYLFKQFPIKNRYTIIPRTVFVDSELFFIIKSAPMNNAEKVTTVRRTLNDFMFLQKWLSYENPYSWIPTLKTQTLRNPFAVPMKPSRQVMHEIQSRLNAFLRIMMSHPTFSSHELLWEFLLIQEFSKDTNKDRCKRKLESEKDKQYNDLTVYNKGDLELVKTFFQHATRETKKVYETLAKLSTCSLKFKAKLQDLSDSHKVFSDKLTQVEFFHETFENSVAPYYNLANSIHGVRSLSTFCYDLSNMTTTTQSVIAALSHPLTLIEQLETQESTVYKLQLSLEKLNSKTSWPMGMFEEKRERDVKDAQDRIYVGQNDIRRLSSDIKYSHIVAASELGGFYIAQEEELKRVVGNFAQAQIRTGQERLMRLERLHQCLKSTKL